MEKMDKKRIGFLLLSGAILLVVLRLDDVAAFFHAVVSLLFPIGFGLGIAFVLNIPVSGVERFLQKHLSFCSKKAGRARFLALVLTILGLVLFAYVLVISVLPELRYAVKELAAELKRQWPQVLAFFEKNKIDTSQLKKLVDEWNVSGTIEEIPFGVPRLVGSLSSAASTVFSAVGTVMTVLIVAIYAVLGKVSLVRQIKKLLYALFSSGTVDKCCAAGKLIQQTFRNYLVGQCAESALLGVLMFVVFTVTKLPSAALVAFLTAIFAIVPYVGAFVACTVAVLLALLQGPFVALKCLIVYQVVQFIENRFLYPHIVGGSVGLPPFWTLIAILIGGRLFGVVGMVACIPLAAVLYEMVRAIVHHRLEQKKINIA